MFAKSVAWVFDELNGTLHDQFSAFASSLGGKIAIYRKPPENRSFSTWHARRNLKKTAATFAGDV
ncbi:MAG TPA: hypothetical protein DDZ51_02835 [Planctomycetaceae bacterium]|nr:hypothetical protein [Planctomycetaceae bacterium]